MQRERLSALRGIVLGGLVAACLLGACSSGPSGDSGPATSAAGAPAAGSEATRGGEFGALTARGLVDALAKTGFAVPNPRDLTAQKCPAAGCDQAIVTDTVSVESFATTGRAQLYAGDHRLFHVETVVVEFAPAVLPADRDRYRAQIKALMR